MNANDILESSIAAVNLSLMVSYIPDLETKGKVEFICRCNTNKAPIRFLISCLLAKIDRPSVDIRKPYTEIEGDDTYSGRAYDEGYVESFVAKYKLPCNATTAFLTPAFRNIDRLLAPELVLVGKPRAVYDNTLYLLDQVYKGLMDPETLLKEILRFLLVIKAENEGRMLQLIADLKQSDDVLPLSSEQIVILLYRHLNCKNSSRLPVLIVAAAYLSVNDLIGEHVLPLKLHNAADSQTGSVGDIEIVLANEEKIVTCYEMKDKRVTINDINNALAKISKLGDKIDNYIFVTTDIIESEVTEYAKSIYDQVGVEIIILDCLGFAKHFLHFFHRRRAKFIDIYQEIVLNEPNSSVGQSLKEAFLILRKQAESN